MSERERIEMAAIRLPNGEVLTTPRPGRHHTIINNTLGWGPEAFADQGFVTNTGEYLNRWQAWRCAEKAGQIIRQTGPKGKLFSEDLW